MIVVDTNVLSELFRPAPEPNVVAWVASKPRSALFTTTITRAEILYGIALIPEGKRRDALLPSVQEIFDEDFAGQVLPSTAMRPIALPPLPRPVEWREDRSASSTWSQRWRVRGGRAWQPAMGRISRTVASP